MEIANCIREIYIADMNQPLEAKDTSGGRSVHWRKNQEMRDMIDMCKLMDIGFFGLSFTWVNRSQDATKIQERIDRAWCNTA